MSVPASPVTFSQPLVKGVVPVTLAMLPPLAPRWLYPLLTPPLLGQAWVAPAGSRQPPQALVLALPPSPPLSRAGTVNTVIATAGSNHDGQPVLAGPRWLSLALAATVGAAYHQPPMALGPSASHPWRGR